MLPHSSHFCSSKYHTHTSSFPQACGNPRSGCTKFLKNFGVSLRFWVATQVELWKLLPDQSCSRREEKKCKKERPVLWLSASGGGWRQRSVNRLRGAHNGKACSCLGRDQFLLTAPISTIHELTVEGFAAKPLLPTSISCLQPWHQIKGRISAVWVIYAPTILNIIRSDTEWK